MWKALTLQTGRPEVASDAVAEAFAQALRRGEVISHPDRWVWKAAFRLAAAELKRRPYGDTRQDVAYEFLHEAVILVEALAHLSPMQRAAIILRYHGGYTSAEIAAILGSSSTAVRVHLLRGRRRLARMMGVDDG